jgi:hypothetical protein
MLQSHIDREQGLIDREQELQARFDDVQLKSLSSTFEELIRDNTILQADLQRKSKIMNQRLIRHRTPQGSRDGQKGGSHNPKTRPQAIRLALAAEVASTRSPFSLESGWTLSPEVILLILETCDRATLGSLLRLNKTTNQMVTDCINTYPAKFFQNVYPSFITLETEPVQIYTVPPLDKNLFKDPTPVKLLQSLPKVFTHEYTQEKCNLLPLPYATEFLQFLQLVAQSHPQLQTIVNSYPLPVGIVPMMEPLSIELGLINDKILKMCETRYTAGINSMVISMKNTVNSIKQHPHILLRLPKSFLQNTTQVSTSFEHLFSQFLKEFLQPHPNSVTNCVSFNRIVYQFISGHGYKSVHDHIAQEIQQLGMVTEKSALPTIHACFFQKSYSLPPIPGIVNEIVLETRPKNYWGGAFEALKCMLGIKSFRGISKTSHNVKTLRLLDYNLNQESLAMVLFQGQNIPNLIFHVPEGCQLTEDLTTDLQQRVDNSDTLQSIEICTAYNGINWRDSKVVANFTKSPVGIF